MEFYVCHHHVEGEVSWGRFRICNCCQSNWTNQKKTPMLNSSKPTIEWDLSTLSRSIEETWKSFVTLISPLIFHHQTISVYYGIIFGISIGNLTNKRLRKKNVCCVLQSLFLALLFFHCITNYRLHVVFNFSRWICFVRRLRRVLESCCVLFDAAAPIKKPRRAKLHLH